MLQDSCVDIAVISEVEVGEVLPILPGYSVYKPVITEGSKTRLLVYVKQALVGLTLLLTEYMDKDVPTIWLNVDGLIVCGIYRQWTPNVMPLPGGFSSSDFQKSQLMAIVEQVNKAVKEGTAPVVVAGDVNLNFDKLDSTHRSQYAHWHMLQMLQGALDVNDLIRIGTGPTWTSYGKHGKEHRSSTIDMIAVSGRLQTPTVSLLPTAASDHAALLTEITLPRSKKRQPVQKECIERRQYQTLTTETLTAALNSTWDWDTRARSWTVDELASYIADGINTALDVCCPKKTFTVCQGREVYLTAETRAVMQRRDRARALRLPSYRRLRNRAAALVKRDKIQTLLKATAEKGQEAVWSAVKRFTGSGTSSRLPMLEGAANDAASAKKCNEYYINKVDKIRESLSSKRSAPETNEPAPTKSGAGFSFTGVTAGVVDKLIRGLKSKRSTGNDHIPALVYKMGREVLASPIAHLCTLSLTSGVYPAMYKDAIVKPLHKGGGKPQHQATSYRPVSLLPVISKILEKAALAQMMSFLKRSMAFPNEQHGFREGRSTTTAIGVAHAAWAELKREQKREKKYMAVTAFDMTAAFDCLDCSALTLELERLGFGNAALKWVNSYMTGGSQRVSWNGTLSPRLQVQHGVRQGSVLGPVFFIIVTRNLPALFTDAVCYADDFTSWVVGKDREELQELVERQAANFVQAAADLGLKANPEKTKVMVIAPGRESSSVEFNVDGAIVSSDTYIDILGTRVNADLTLDRERILTDIRRRVGIISRLSTYIPRGKPLTVVAKALVLGKLHSDLPLTADPRLLTDDTESSMARKLQVTLNDLARTLLGKKRCDRIPVDRLLTKAKLTSYNQMAVQRCALEAWKAMSTQSPLSSLMHPVHSSITRSAAAGMVSEPEPSKGASLARSAPRIWNACRELREAKSIGFARSAARKFSQKCPL